MNPTRTLIAIGALCAAVVVWHLRIDPKEPGTAPPLSESVPPAATTLAPEPTPATPEPSTTPLAQVPEASPTAAATGPETEQVLGLRVRKDRNCTLRVHHVVDAETGEPVTAYSCVPHATPTDDPYDNWDEEVLAGLAYGDAHAAEVLGLRHIAARDPVREALGLALLYRSVALSGRTDALNRAIAARYGYVADGATPDIHNLKQLLIFSRIGQTLGDSAVSPTDVLAALARAGVPDEEIQAMEAGSESILQVMASIQTEVTGERSISEALGNA